MKRLEWANALRGLAALIVIGYHFGVAFWWRQDETADLARRDPLFEGIDGVPGWSRALHAVPIDFAALGVSTFFLLSGYVIAISLDRYSRLGFLIGRTMRVLPTYAAGFLITCATIAVVGDPKHELHPSAILAGLIPGVRFLVAGSPPSDGVVWTLIVELVFYAVCLVGYRSLTSKWYTIAAVAVMCAVFQWAAPVPNPATPLGGLAYVLFLACPFIPIMLVGVSLSAHRSGRLRRAPTVALVVALTATYLVLASTSSVAPASLAYRLTFAGTVALFTAIWAFGGGWRRHRITDFLADISYPLYVVHSVLGYAIISALTSNGVPTSVAVGPLSSPP